jgi:endonuclease/exonuclease/phosphatase (EEP) superfamily protein YafD
VLTAALTGISAAWFVFVLLHRLLSGRFWLWLLPDLVPPLVYLAVPVALLVTAPVAGPWAAGLAAAALVAGGGDGGLNLFGVGPEPAPAEALRLVSWNTRYWHQGQDPVRFYGFLRDLRADVYALQEYVYGPHRGLTPVDDLAGLCRAFPGYHVVARGELVTLSRFPVEAAPALGPATELCPEAEWRRVFDLAKVLRTDLRVGGAALSVYNVHMPAQCAPGDNPLTRRFFAELAERAVQRRAQFAGLLSDLEANCRPAVVTGDFNSTGAMGEMRPLFRRLASANLTSPRRYLSSWPARGASLWQVDWTFTSGARVHRYELVDPQELSDHRVQELLVSV